MQCYLGGAMSGLTFNEMNEWRVEAKEQLEDRHIKAINPVVYYNFEMNPDEFTNHECISFDLTAVKHSDVILVNLEHNSIGTAIELFQAHELHIPIVGFNYNNDTHPWIKELVDVFCNNLNEAISYITTYYATIM